MSTTENTLLLIGKIYGIFGIQGWVKVFSYCDPIDNICLYSPWLIGHQDNLQSVKVTSKKHSKTIIAKLPDINTVEDANRLLNSQIFIHTSALPTLENSYYYFQLKGLKVVGIDEFVFGTVDYTFDTGSNSVIVVKNATNDTQYYIPLIEPYLVEVNLQDKCITVDWDKNF